MAYSDFTKEQLETDFGIEFDADYLFPEIQKIEPSEWLKNAIQLGWKMGFRSEKARSERFVSPILTELTQLNDFNFTVYSGEILNGDKERGLNGECDFILSWSLNRNQLTAPIFCLTEAEKNDLDKGINQVSAQLVGAHYFNQKTNNLKIEKIYGCATNGLEWQFLMLEGNRITTHAMPYSLGNLAELLGILQFIIESAKSK